MSDALYDGPNRVIIDDNTPETNTLPVSGGKGVDEFLITSDANTVTINDDSGANVIVFERDVVITSIERQAGSEGASVAQYVITLSSGKTITLRNPASFTFQHLGDATRTAPISAEDFFTAYEDGFAASDASHPDIIGDASGPSGVQGPMITGTATGAVTEDDAGRSTATGTLMAPGQTIGLDGADNLGRANGTYGTMSFDVGSGVWTYTLDNSNDETNKLAENTTAEDLFTFSAGTSSYTVTITVSGANDAPEISLKEDGTAVSIDFQEGRVNQELTPIHLSGLFTDVDGDELSLSFEVSRSGSNVVERLSDIGLTHETTDSTTGAAVSRIIGTPTTSGLYTIKVIATDGSMEDDGSGGERPVTATSTFSIFIRADRLPIIRDVADSNLTSGVGTVMEDGTLTAEETIVITDPDGDPAPPIVLDGANTNTGILAGQYGMMAFVEATGTWTYTLNNNHTMVQGLGDSETLTETFTFTALGAENFDVEITITGVNDAPVLLSNVEPPNADATQNQSIETGDLRRFFTDKDTNDELTLTVTLSDGAALDTIGLTYDGSSGKITGVPNTIGTYTIKAVASDGTADAADALTFTITVRGHEITGTAAGSVTEDDQSSSSVRGTLTASEGLTIALQGGNGVSLSPDGSGNTQYGSMRFDASASQWVYVLGNANTATQNLSAGQTVNEVFTFAAGDVTFDVTITITGRNDAPTVATTIEPQSGVEGLEKVIDLSNLFTDIDTNDTLTLSVVVELAGTEIVFDGSRNIISVLSASKELRITLASTGTHTVTVKADDGNSGTATSTFSLEVDADTPPVIGIPGSEDRTGVGAVTEDGTLTATGVLEVTDIDNPPTLPTIELNGDGVGTYGTMTFDGRSWTYTLAATPEQGGETQALTEGQTETETFTFSAGVARFEVTITVTGVNDAPTVSGEFFTREGPIGGQFILSNLSDRFTDVDEGDELTFEVTFHDSEDAEVDIGLTYNSDEDEITGTLTEVGTYVIKIVATDKIGATVEATFELNIFSAIPEIQRNSLTYNPDETSITIDETMLEVTSGNESDPTLLVYTITTLPDAGRLLKSGTQLNNGDTFTQADINNGLITYEPDVGNPSTSQSNPLSFTISDGVATSEEETLEITSREVVGNTVYEGDPSTSGDLDVDDDTLLASTTPFTISTQGTYGTASIGDDGEWVYKLDNGDADVTALNSGDTLTDTFVVDVNLASGRAETQIVTITISGRTDVLGTNGEDKRDSSLGDASTSDNQAIFGFNSRDILTGGSGDDLLVGGYGLDLIDLSADGIDTVVHRINSSDGDGLVKAEDGGDRVMEFTPGEDKLIILDVNESPTTLAALFDSLTKDAFQLGLDGNNDGNFILSSSELDAGARAFIRIVFQVVGRFDGGPPSSAGSGLLLQINFDRVTSEALSDMAVWDTLTGGTNFSSATILDVAQLSSLFGGFGRPGYDAALDDGGFISIIGPDDLPDSYFEIPPQTISGDETGSVTEGGAPGDDNTGTLTAPGHTITLVSKETTDSPGMSTGKYGVMAFDGTIWTYTLDGRAEMLADGQTATERFTFSAGGGTFVVTITITGTNDAPPVIGIPGSGDRSGAGAVTEDGTLTAAGVLEVTDADNPAILPTIEIDGDGIGTYGTMTFDESSGEWTYTLAVTPEQGGETQALTEGQTETETFTFRAGVARFEVTITVTGVNDAPVVSGEFFNREGEPGERFTLSNLSDRFTDVDQDDELTFEVTLDDGAALSTIGLTYDSDEDEITGTLTRTGTYVIKIVATDKIGATVETTFDLNIFFVIPIIQRNSLTYNPDETSITIDETMLEVTSGNESDPTLLVYTITTLPDAGRLLKSGTQLNNGDTFTQADINNGLITYEPDVGSPSTSQSNPLSFTISDGEADLEETLEITSREVVGNTAYEGDPSTSGDLDVDDDTLLASTTPFTISTQGTYGTASIGDDGEWVYKLDNGDADVSALNSGDTLTDTFVVDVNLTNGSAKTQTVTITISGRTDVRGSNGRDLLGDASTSDNQAIFGFNSADRLTGGSGDDLLVGGYGLDIIDLSADGIDTVVYRINSSARSRYLPGDRVKAEDGGDRVMEFTPGEDKLIILDVNGSPTTLAGFFDSLTKDVFQLGVAGDTDGNGDLSSSELDAGARAFIQIRFQEAGTVDGGSGGNAGDLVIIYFDRVTSEALNDRAVWDTLTGGTNFSSDTISTVAQLSSLFGGFGRPGYDAALDDGGFISIIGPDDLPGSYFEIPPQTISGDETGSVTEGGVPGDDNTGTLTAPGHTITLVSKETTDSPGTSTGKYGVMAFDGTIWTYTLDDRAEVLADGQTATERFTFSAGGGTFVVTITITGTNDAPVVATAIEPQSGVEGQEKVIDLSNLFSDIDTNDTLTLSVTAELDGNEITFDGSSNIISDLSASKELRITLASTGAYTVTVMADDGNGGRVSSSFNLEVEADNYAPVIGIPGSEDKSGAGAVAEDGTLIATGVLEVTDADNPPTLPTIELDGDGVGTYGTMTFDGSSWTYTLAVTPEQGGKTQALTEGQIETETFIFSAGGATFEVTITITGANDAPVVESGNEIVQQAGRVGQEITAIDLSGLFTDVDTGNTFTLTVMVLSSDGNTRVALDTLGLEYNSDTKMITGILSNSIAAGIYTIEVIATDGGGRGAASQPSTFNIVVAPNTVYEGDPSTSGDLDVNDDTLLASTTPFTISTQGTYGTASIGDDGEWVYKLDNGNADVTALNSGDTLTDTFVVDVNLASGRAETQTVTITIRGRTDVFGTNGRDSSVGDASTSDNQAIFGFNGRIDTLTGGSGDDLLVGGYGIDTINLRAGGTDTVVYRINSSDTDGKVKAEDGFDVVEEFTPGEDKLVILDVNGSPTTLAGLFDSLTKYSFQLRINGDANGDRNLSSSELDAGARARINIVFQARATVDGAGSVLTISFDRVTSEALNDRAVWDTLTGGTNFSENAISTVAQLSSLFGGFGRPGYDAALDDGGFISIIGPDDLPDSYFAIISGDEIGSVTEGGAPGDDNTGTLTAPGNTITLVSKETTDSPGMSTGTYGVMRFNVSSGEWVYTLDDRAEALVDQQTETESFIFSAGGETFEVTITITGANDAPVVESGNEIGEQAGRVSQEITAIDLSGLFTDVDTGDTFTLTVMVLSSDGNTKMALDTLGLEYNSDTKMITGTLLNSIAAGIYTIEVIATDGGGRGAASQPSTFNIVVAPNTAYEGDPSTSGDLDVNDDTLLASTTPFTISTQGTYGTASIDDDGEWVYTLDNGNADVTALNSGDTLTDTFVVDVNLASGRATTQTITITISGRTDVRGSNGRDSSLGDASTSDNQAIFGFNSGDTLTGGSGDDLLVGGYGVDFIDLSAGGTDTVVYRINSSDGDGLVKAEDGSYEVMEFTPGEDKLVILDVNGSPTTLAALFDRLTKGYFRLRRHGDDDSDANLSSSELDAGARAFIWILFFASGTDDGGPTSAGAGRMLQINFDRVTSEALNDRAVWDTLTEGTNFRNDAISTVAQLSSLFGGFGRPGYDAALDDGGFISIIGPDDLPDSYFEIVPISGDETGSVTEGGAPGDDNTGTLTLSGNTITLVSKEITDSPGTSTGTYGVMRFNVSSGEWVYTLDDRAEALGDQQTATETFIFRANGTMPLAVTITITGVNDAPVVESGNEIVEQAGRVGQEITAIDLSGLFTDVDTIDTFTLTVMVLSSDGNTRMALDTLGLEYNSDTKMITGTLLNSIAAGTYTIEVIATDGGGRGAASQPSTFDIVVAPDSAPVISGDVAISIVEDAADPITGTLTITDADDDALPTVALSDGAGQYGTLTFVARADGGVWTYTLDNANEAVQALGVDDTLTDEFTFTAEGAAPITVTITITGANDAPTVSGEFFTRERPTGERFTLSNLSDRFTDVDQGDELTFTVTLDDGAALSTIGLTYDSDEDEITGTLTGTGTYVIKIVATDKSGATVEATFDPNILSAGPIIQRNSLTYNPDATSITIDETMLEVTSGNASDPALLIYTITTLPDAGMLLKSGAPLNNGDTFTQADINNGLITYVPNVGNPFTSQSNPLSFTISDGEADIEETLQITSREVFEDETPAQDNEIDQSSETTPQKIEAGDGSDTITSGQKDDQIDGGAGDDEIILTRTVNNVAEDAGADEVLYAFDYDGVGIDGGDEIVGFKRGQDKVTFVIDRNFDSLTAFLESLKGEDEEDLTADDAFIVTMVWGLDKDDVFYFDSVLLHFKDASAFGGGRVSSPLVTVTFDERLDFDDLVEILGEVEKVAENFDFTHAAFKNLDEVLPRLFGKNSIDFEVRPIDEVLVIDGPVTGAEVFFDIDDDGEVSDVEKDAQRDESGRSRYLTGDDGTVDIPEQYVGRAFVADVGSAYDTATGERLEGSFRSLDEGRGGIATPITDLIVTYLEEVEGQAGTPTTEQEVLDEIFGDDVVTLADILAARNYEIPADTDTPRNNKKDLISRAAIALTEIKENDDLADGDGDGSTTKVEIVSALKTLTDSPDDTSVAELKEVVEARVAEVNAVKGGKPIATPASVDGVEDTDYAFPDTPEALTELFGFLDPSGNDPAADTSSFRGVYIRIAIENASLRLDDNTQVVADTDLSGSDTVDAIAGYVYVTFDNLDGLKITPAPNFNGDLALVYRVWDGEEVSSDAELIINIAGVNDAPTLVDDGVTTRNVTVGQPVTDITQAYLLGLFNDIDGDALILMVTGLSSGLSHNSTDGITGTPTASGTITVTVVANDGNGGTVEKTLKIAVGQIVNADTVDPVTGTISLADPTPPNNLQGAYGALKFDVAPKTWTYTLDAAATQALRAGEERTETFTFTDSSNADTELVIITVVGVNDAPMVDTAIGPQRVMVDLPVTAIILENFFSDADDDELTLTVTGLPSGLSYARDTGIIGTPDTEGIFTVTVVANDGNGGIVETTFDIVVGQIVNADTVDPVTGTISLADPTPPNNLQGAYGALKFDAATKTWTYTLDAAATQALRAGEERTEIFTFTDSSNADSELVIITVVGVNDAPVVDTAIGPQRGTVDLPVTAIILENFFSDADDDELTLTVTGLPSGLSYARDTGITGTPDTVGTFTVTVVANDGNGGIVETTFDIVVSAQVISPSSPGDDAGTVNEGETAATTGETATGDLEVIGATGTPPTIMLEGDGNGTYGRIAFDGTTWTYTLDNTNEAVQALGVDDTLEETFIFSANGTMSLTVTITITGANDAPVVESGDEIGEQAGRVGQEITAIDLSGLFTDVDTGDSFTLTVMVLSSDGSTKSGLDTLGLEYDSDTKMITGTLLNSVVAGTYTIEVIATDGGGRGDESQPSTFNIVVVHPPVIGNYSPTEIGEDAGSPITGTLAITDQDSSGPFQPIALTDDSDGTDDGIVMGDYGTLTFVSSTGTWTYMVDDRAQALNDTPGTDRFVFTSEGATDFELVITVNGANDAPVVDTAIGPQRGTVDLPVTAIILENLFSDVDDDELTLTVTGLPSGLSYARDTGITGTPDTVGTFTVTVVANDGNGGIVETTFDIIVDDAVVNGVSTRAEEFLIGGDNVQTLNAGTEGDAIFGGKGDDIINLGGGKDFVFYRYDGDDTDDTEASDGADVINDFDLDEDILVLAHESNEVHENSNAFYEAIKGISLLVDGDGNVTGIVFTFTDRSNTTQEVDLTVNFEDDLAPPTGLEAAFDNTSSGEREITSGQETAAYRVINEIFGGNLVLIDFDDIGFELNTAETDIV